MASYFFTDPKNTCSSVSEVFERTIELDFSIIRRKLMDKEHGPGWTKKHTDEAELLYRCFLALQATKPEDAQPVVPPKLADEYWHQHILDTRKYAADCEILYGRFLHHYPYFGMRGPEDKRALEVASKRTHDLFKEHFSAEIVDLADCSSCSSCK